MKTLLIKKLKIEMHARKKGRIIELADAIRKGLEDNGIVIEDKQEQTLWKYK